MNPGDLVMFLNRHKQPVIGMYLGKVKDYGEWCHEIWWSDDGKPSIETYQELKRYRDRFLEVTND